LIGVGGCTLTPITHQFWRKCVPRNHVNEIKIHTHLSISKCKTNLRQIGRNFLCTPGTNLVALYKKNVLSKDSMSNVDENVDESKSLGNNPIVSNEDQDQHDPLNSLMKTTFHFQDCCLI
jgi:hypothetical protein